MYLRRFIVRDQVIRGAQVGVYGGLVFHDNDAADNGVFGACLGPYGANW